MARPHRLMYGLLYPAVLGTVFVNLFPPLMRLVANQTTNDPEICVKLVLALGIVFHFIVDYLLAQEAPDHGWPGFAIDLLVLIALWTSAASVHLDSDKEPDIRTLCYGLATTYALFLIWLGFYHKQIRRKVFLVTVEVVALLWFLVGGLLIVKWNFSAIGLFGGGILLAWAANKAQGPTANIDAF